MHVDALTREMANTKHGKSVSAEERDKYLDMLCKFSPIVVSRSGENSYVISMCGGVTLGAFLIVNF